VIGQLLKCLINLSKLQFKGLITKSKVKFLFSLFGFSYNSFNIFVRSDKIVKIVTI
jgi:hypothetical protein